MNYMGVGMNIKLEDVVVDSTSMRYNVVQYIKRTDVDQYQTCLQEYLSDAHNNLCRLESKLIAQGDWMSFVDYILKKNDHIKIVL